MNLHFPFIHRPDIVVTIHGFGRRVSHEMDPLKAWLEKQGFEVWTFDYFDPQDPGDTRMEDWIGRCEAKLRQAIATGRPVHLLGFSMGGVVSSYLASVFKVKHLLLCAPAYFPLDFYQVERAARKALFPFSDGDSGSLSRNHTQTFLKVVSTYRYSILQVDCPVLILHGTADEVISAKSSERMISLLDPAHTRLLYLYGAKHRFLYDGTYESIVFPIIRDYFRNEMTPFH